jgi:hypothetical protein
MHEWLNRGNAPALVYIRDLNTWATVNSETELLSWTEDPKEIAWLSDWVSKSAESEKRACVVRKSKLVPVRAIRSHDIVLPMRQPWVVMQNQERTGKKMNAPQSEADT